MTDMTPSESAAALAEFVRSGSQQSFERIVAAHVGLVYAAALRQVSDAHLAEDVTQAVFIVLSRKAHSLSASTILSGWLIKTTRFCAANALRRRARQRHHEREAATMRPTVIQPETAKQDLAEMLPHLDAALAKLAEADRAAVVMRFFEQRPAREISLALGTSEDAARQRIGRAVEKLRSHLRRAGAVLSAGAVVAALDAYAMPPAPSHLAGSVLAAALSSASGSSAALIAKAAASMMRWVQLKLATGAAIVVTCAAAVGIPVVLQVGQNSPAPATTPATAPATQPWKGTVHVQALIDGRSQLMVRGNTVRWYHLEFAAPGRHAGANEPTVINGAQWMPEWPDVDWENRQVNTFSSFYEQLDPPLPQVAVKAEVKVLHGRGHVLVYQQPSPDNDYTLIIEFDDNESAGSEQYDVEIAYEQTNTR